MGKDAQPQEYNLCVVGPDGVGKTALPIQFTMNIFGEEYDPTIEDEFSKQIVIDDEPALLNIWDTSGNQEGYTGINNMRLMDLRKGDGFLVYSVTKFLDREVSTDEGARLASLLGCPFIETSAKDRVNVEEAFSELVREIRKYEKEQQIAAKAAEGSSGADNREDARCACRVVV
ncbi:hypothetical protein NLJ89_g7885 [Agrocybe chaxingu]|uniref:Uncharacterized protein n=1 Tax=Agrocybe chaxingu TaxID=84603 RepID=A0A9W8MSN9_9AGAR|nr:hypothetical protein NLJ89_g7885 [Agrocybe chaxingu]